MVTYIPINASAERTEYSQKIKKALDSVFWESYCHVNAHVLFDLKSPTERFGKYDFLLLIDVPYELNRYGRYNCCKRDGCFINSIAIAVRRIDLPDVVDVDDEFFYTEEGSYNYKEEIESERISLCKFVYDNIPNIKRFDINVIYNVSSPKCSKKFYHDELAFNRGIPLSNAITYAVNSQKNWYGRVNALLWNNFQRNATWDSFIGIFIDATEKFTKQGILTIRKVNSITKNKKSRDIEKALSVIGNKLCIISGRPGTGKTHALLCLMYNQVRRNDTNKSHHCRLLTYNNMLVTDLNQALKCIGDFNPTNASISTLHKFFFDIYIKSPIKDLGLDLHNYNYIIALCLSRVAKINALLDTEYVCSGNTNLRTLFETIYDNGLLDLSERSEFLSYKDNVLKCTNDYDIYELDNFAIKYVKEKRDKYLNNYYKREFFSNYNVILEQLYLMFHDPNEFRNRFNGIIPYSTDDIMDSEELRKLYQDLLFSFIRDAENRFKNNAQTEEVAKDFLTLLDQLDEKSSTILSQKTDKEKEEVFAHRLKTIKRKVNWSRNIFVDEGQDCQLYEKALLLELNGSSDTIVAHGGASQLIRTAVVNDWSVCLGERLLVENISLQNQSCRQKGNIVDFINLFARNFNIGTQLSVPNELLKKGRVIIDCRQILDNFSMPNDVIKELFISGKDYNCSNYENLLFLFPQTWLEREENEELEVEIDTFGYIDIRPAAGNRRLRNLDLPDDLSVIDGTVNDKRELRIGQGNTRCILYDSCRGLEAWNVLCIDFDSFYYEKLQSRAAEEYSISNADLFINTDSLKAKYAALWCYMAMTRAMDTLYIKLSSRQSTFSSSILKLAEQLEYVEIFR